MALSAAQKQVMTQKLEGVAAIAAKHLKEGALKDTETYDLFERIVPILEADEANQAEQVANLINNAFTGEIDFNGLRDEIQGAVTRGGEIVQDPGCWKSCWESLKSCFCVCGSVTAKFVGPAVEAVAVAFIEQKVDGMKINAAAKAALKATNSKALHTTFSAFYAKLDAYADNHADELKDNVYVQQALVIANEMKVDEILADTSIKIGDAEIDISTAVTAATERMSKRDGADDASSTAPAVTQEEQMKTLSRAATVATMSADVPGITAGSSVTREHLLATKRALKGKLVADAQHLALETLNELDPKVLKELQKNPALLAQFTDMAVHLAEERVAKTMDEMSDVASTLDGVMHAAARFRALTRHEDEDGAGAGAGAAAGSGAGAAGSSPVDSGAGVGVTEVAVEVAGAGAAAVDATVDGATA